MEFKEKSVPEKIKAPVSSIVLYVASSVTAILALASLINTIIIYNGNVDHYVKVGYPASEVIKQLVQTQLLPGLFQSIALYGGIAVVLLGAGIINHKISSCLFMFNKNPISNATASGFVPEDNSPAESPDSGKQEEITEGNEGPKEDNTAKIDPVANGDDLK